MKNNHAFSIRLANGREQTFDTAAAMAAWMALERETAYRPRRDRAGRAGRRAVKQGKRNRQVERLPLARFANRFDGRSGVQSSD